MVCFFPNLGAFLRVGHFLSRDRRSIQLNDVVPGVLFLYTDVEQTHGFPRTLVKKTNRNYIISDFEQNLQFLQDCSVHYFWKNNRNTNFMQVKKEGFEDFVLRQLHRFANMTTAAISTTGAFARWKIDVRSWGRFWVCCVAYGELIAHWLILILFWRFYKNCFFGTFDFLIFWPKYAGTCSLHPVRLMWTINSLVQNKCKLQVMSSLLLIMSVGTLAFREVLSFCDVKFVGRKKHVFSWMRCPNVHVPPNSPLFWLDDHRDSKLDFLGPPSSIHLVQVFASDLESGITTTMKATFWGRIWQTPKKQETAQFLENATRLPPSSILKTLSWDTSKNMGLAGFFP